jgi:TonB family protein
MAFLLWLVAAVPGASADEIDRLLARPVTPGTLALIYSHAPDPRVPQAIRDAAALQGPLPVFPSGAQLEGRQGLVVLESVISPTGCVREVRVLRQTDVDFDIAAIRAVSDWAFTPTLLNGRPVPVVMTVTVQFSLR